MPKKSPRAAVVARGGPRWLLAAAMAAAALLGACAAVPGPGTRAERPPSPPKEALAFDDAVAALTVALFARAQPALPASAQPRPLVVDPLIDRATGNQAAATRSMEGRMVAIMRERFPQVEPRPFTPRELDRRPLVLVGSITTVAGPGVIPTLGCSCSHPGSGQPDSSWLTSTTQVGSSRSSVRTRRSISCGWAWLWTT